MDKSNGHHSDASLSSMSSGENDVFAIQESLIPLQDQKSAGITELALDNLLDPPLKLREDLKEGCGGQLWPAGMLLARYMLLHYRDHLADKAILEIGAGGGLVGLAVARGCNIPSSSPRLYITDQTPMFNLMTENIALNDLGSRVVAAVYDWGTPLPDIIDFAGPKDHAHGHSVQSRRRPDIVLAADCVYFEPSFPLLRDTLVGLLNPSNPDRGHDAEDLAQVGQEQEGEKRPICFFAFKKRRKADWRFLKMVQKQLLVEEIQFSEGQRTQDDGIARTAVEKGRVFLYKIMAKPR